MEAMITAEGLSKTFRVARRRPGLVGGLRSIVDPQIRSVAAVRSIDLEIARGEIVGLIGPNGAGKSTTIKMLTGILTPSDGRLRVAGLEPVRQRRHLAARIGAVFGQRTQLWWDLPLIDSLRLLRHLYRVPEARFAAQFDRLRAMLELDAFLDTPVRQLSLGQRMRGDLAASLLHAPELLFLDEPTIGLDVVAKASVRDFLRELNRKQETTVLLTTHDMDDIEQLCPRIIIIDQGQKLFDAAIATLRARFGQERQIVTQLDPSIGAIPSPLDLPAGVRFIRADGPRLWFAFGPSAPPAHEIIAWLGARYPLRDLTFQEPEIEDTIRRIYTEGLLRQEFPDPA